MLECVCVCVHARACVDIVHNWRWHACSKQIDCTKPGKTNDSTVSLTDVHTFTENCAFFRPSQARSTCTRQFTYIGQRLKEGWTDTSHGTQTGHPWLSATSTSPLITCVIYSICIHIHMYINKYKILTIHMYIPGHINTDWSLSLHVYT